MSEDTIIGDGGNVTVYERPDGSRYSLDKRGQGSEWDADARVFGTARFDSREFATGRWKGSQSISDAGDDAPPVVPVGRARRRGSRFRTG
ncbi:MAG: hypothetical protein H0V25_00715 [Solirubrobacterales bacterium]|nr:hypothetical protein [Solirubrobacterales bacterium]